MDHSPTQVRPAWRRNALPIGCAATICEIELEAGGGYVMARPACLPGTTSAVVLCPSHALATAPDAGYHATLYFLNEPRYRLALETQHEAVFEVLAPVDGLADALPPVDGPADAVAPVDGLRSVRRVESNRARCMGMSRSVLIFSERRLRVGS